MGHIITSSGIKADPSKISAIQTMKATKDVKELKRFLGMVSYLSKFIKSAATLTDKLRSLDRKGVDFTWTSVHQKDFEKIKEIIA